VISNELFFRYLAVKISVFKELRDLDLAWSPQNLDSKDFRGKILRNKELAAQIELASIGWVSLISVGEQGRISPVCAFQFSQSRLCVTRSGFISVEKRAAIKTGSGVLLDRTAKGVCPYMDSIDSADSRNSVLANFTAGFESSRLLR
jgi:hypothetical protein